MSVGGMQIGDSKEWHAGVVTGVDNEKRTEDALYEVGTQESGV